MFAYGVRSILRVWLRPWPRYAFLASYSLKIKAGLKKFFSANLCVLCASAVAIFSFLTAEALQYAEIRREEKNQRVNRNTRRRRDLVAAPPRYAKLTLRSLTALKMASKCSATKCKPRFLNHFCLVMKHNSSFAVASKGRYKVIRIADFTMADRGNKGISLSYPRASGAGSI